LALITGRAADAVDVAMDVGIVPGFTAIGYRARKRLYSWHADRLEGRSVMVTGANAGIGRAIAMELCRRGAYVHMVCRNPDKGKAARDEIALETGASPELHICDLSSLASVREFATSFAGGDSALDVLINNAGVLPLERIITDEGFELTFATNVLGPFLLTELLLPKLRKSPAGRVVMMSSGGMYSSGFDLEDPQLENREFEGTKFYAQTKRAEVMLADEWQDRAGPGDPVFCSMHPGWADTEGVSNALPTFNKVIGPLLRTAGEGGETAVWLAGASPEEAPGGEFYMDRRPRPKHRVPGTRDTAEDRRRLYEFCAGLTGLGTAGSAAA
jgi:NAD(P)-dependent dehydrogenase (short-subunit alcohol dehydrogenase family)